MTRYRKQTADGHSHCPHQHLTPEAAERCPAVRNGVVAMNARGNAWTEVRRIGYRGYVPTTGSSNT